MVWEGLEKTLIFTGLEEKSDTEILQTLSCALCSGGYVAEDYCQEVVERERRFPTGIAARGMGVAIPHASSRYVYRDKTAIAVLKEPVTFARMDKEHAFAEVRIVFMLALTDVDRHLEYLERIVAFIQDQAVLEALRDAEDAAAVIEIIRKKEMELCEKK